MNTVIIVGIGGALGSIARYLCAVGMARWLGESFPWGTLFVNITGSFVIGFLFTLKSADGRPLITPDWGFFLLVGVCGGYTTFSSLSLQTLLLLRNGEWGLAACNAFGSLALGMAAVFLGFFCAAALNPKG